MQSVKQHSDANELDSSRLISPPAPFWRRLLAISYDSLILICIIFIAWQPVPHIPLDKLPALVNQGIRLIYLFSIIFLFFGWFWRHGGQTIGMRAWKIKLISTASGLNPSWRQCGIRYFVAMLSWLFLFIGFLWALFNPQKSAWHDLASGTSLISTQK